MNILLSLRRQEQYYRLFLGGFAAMPLTSCIIKRFIRFIRNKYKKEAWIWICLRNAEKSQMTIK